MDEASDPAPRASARPDLSKTEVATEATMLADPLKSDGWE